MPSPMNMRACAPFLSYAILILCMTTSFGADNITDWLALLAIKAAITHDPMLVTSSWNESLHFCQWEGVNCSHRHHQRVTALNLNSRNLAGTISPSIGNLSFLQLINLSNNSFQGEIPREIGHLFRLEALSLLNNSFQGQIPAELSLCSNLKFMNLNGNKLVAQLPQEFGSLSKLVLLAVHSNKLEGKIPHSLGNLSTLKILWVSDNRLEGAIPESLGRLKSLIKLGLYGNKLSGLIPPSIYNLSSLTVLSVGRNRLKGSLPHNIGLTLPNIENLIAYDNQLGGSIPFTLSNASNLRILDLSINKFSGGVPVNFENLKRLIRLVVYSNDLGSGAADDLSFISSLTNCSNLKVLHIEDCNFRGVLPNSIANLSNQLEFLLMWENQLSGNIPTGIGNLINLNVLRMGNNQLMGTLPTTVGKLHKLQLLNFGENNLSGEIPPSIGNLSLLIKLGLNENNFQGSIPSRLGNCQNLIVLDLGENDLNGTIPPEVIGLSSLSIGLYLSHNSLTGPLPLEVGKLKTIVVLDVSHNKLSGEIPSTLGSCTSLVQLRMGYNSFSGAIPQSLSTLKGIDNLDLSHNNLSGQFPNFFSTFHILLNLNLSFNDLEGEVPIGGVFSNASAVSIAGNKKLCGGIPELHSPTCSTRGPRKEKFSPELELIIPIICGLLGLILMSSFLILSWLKKKRKQSSSAFSWRNELMKISYEKLLKATNGFSSANLIGRGSFGSVYKGILEPDHTAIAVKVFNLQTRGASKSFMAECEALRNIRHRNLVKIITACSSVDFLRNDFKALVYEFMPNGSLETWLYPITQPSDGYERPRSSLNLHQRLNIAIDAASALVYLHNHCQTPIIHCDLKPSNILLDGDMTACVGDFGLARFLEQPDNETSQNQTSSLGIKGTIGYAAPEYGMGSEASTHGDVYSYGILLLEVFTGKRPTDDMFKDDLNLHKLVEMALPDRVEEIVDHVLLLGGEREQAATSNNSTKRIQVNREKLHECLVSILKVGVACSNKSPSERMDICDAARELHRIKGVLIELGS